jgi:hypothetical protein
MSRTYSDPLQSPSAADPRVVDLRATRVKPDHSESTCGQAQDLVCAPLLDLRRQRDLDGADAHHLIGASEREEAPLRPLDGGALHPPAVVVVGDGDEAMARLEGVDLLVVDAWRPCSGRPSPDPEAWWWCGTGPRR